MFDLNTLIPIIGVFGISAIIFVESGILVGFFLPGDSLLVTAGLLASQGYINIWALIPLTIIAAILGDSVGYFIGAYFGPKIFVREESFFFKKRYVDQTAEFFKKHGKWAIVLARFTPVIRTFIPIMAGVGKMEYRTFLLYNIIGGTLWAGGLCLASYIVGITIPGLGDYIHYIVLAVVLISFIPLMKYMVRK